MTRQALTIVSPCTHEGTEIVEKVRAFDGKIVDVRACAVHGQCTRLFVRNIIPLCLRCNDYIPQDGVSTILPSSDNQTGMSSEPAKMSADSNGRANDSKASSIVPEGRSRERLSSGTRPYARPANAHVANGMTYAPSMRERAYTARRTARYSPTIQTLVNQTESRTIIRRTWDKPPIWQYGVTTVPERNPQPLVRTLNSLKLSGFDHPTLFIDGDKNWTWWEKEFSLPVVCRYPRIRTFGNWILTMIELYIRNPTADFYAVFQDDFVCSKNLRSYLESIRYPDKGYLNLLTFPQNHVRIRDKVGFSRATGWRGAGAVALVFNHDALQALLTHGHMASRINPRKPGHDAARAYRYVDGAIVETMEAVGYAEYVHNPSLVQHTGLRSSTGNPRHPLSPSFRGESFDLMTLLNGVTA